jgi:hypothetical protein
MSTGSDCSQVLKLSKSQIKALQEAMYHSAENGHLGKLKKTWSFAISFKVSISRILMII